jgi:hypothetical protein
MGTKEILLLASGVAIGYLVFKKDLFKKVEEKTIDIVDGATKDVKELVNPKKTECEEKFIEFAQTIRPSSQEAFDKIKENFMTSCLSEK